MYGCVGSPYHRAQPCSCVSVVVAEGMFAAVGAEDFSLGALDLGTSEALEQVRQAGMMRVWP